MSAFELLPRSTRRRNALFGIALLLPLPLLAMLPSRLLPDMPTITTASACPARLSASCSPESVERLRMAIEVLTVGAPPVLAALAVVAVLALIASGRRSWPAAVLGLALMIASMTAGVELAMVNAAP